MTARHIFTSENMRVLTFAMIRSTSYNQDEILRWIIQLYVPYGRFDVDPTYSIGNFYRSLPKPEFCFDIWPRADGVAQADCRALPFSDESIASIILDLPFLATTGKSLSTGKGNIINRRFSVCSSEAELVDLYRDAIREAYRMLKRKGILVFKCQDKVSSGKQYMMHCLVHSMATALGFETLDLFVLLAKNRLVANWQRNQKHARKYHSYFWVFRKK